MLQNGLYLLLLIFCNSLAHNTIYLLQLVTALEKFLAKNLAGCFFVFNFALPEGHSRGDSDGTHLSNS